MLSQRSLPQMEADGSAGLLRNRREAREAPWWDRRAGGEHGGMWRGRRGLGPVVHKLDFSPNRVRSHCGALRGSRVMTTFAFLVQPSRERTGEGKSGWRGTGEEKRGWWEPGWVAVVRWDVVSPEILREGVKGPKPGPSWLTGFRLSQRSVFDGNSTYSKIGPSPSYLLVFGAIFPLSSWV